MQPKQRLQQMKLGGPYGAPLSPSFPLVVRLTQVLSMLLQVKEHNVRIVSCQAERNCS
jgi:hypothetical protein